jgi:hypothetical protein
MSYFSRGIRTPCPDFGTEAIKGGSRKVWELVALLLRIESSYLLWGYSGSRHYYSKKINTTTTTRNDMFPIRSNSTCPKRAIYT